MQNQTEKIKESCPRTEIAAYIDGELSPVAEMALEKHFAVCKNCEAEFNVQKKLLRALDFAFDEKSKIELPENFTKTVVIKAESNVSGLRRREERFRALYLCTILFLLVIIGLGNETETVFSTFTILFEQLLAVGSFAAHLIFDIAIALSAILRIIGGQLIYTPVFAVLTVAVFLIFSAYIFSRLLSMSDRSKNLETG